jgi:hypothetical protein
MLHEFSDVFPEEVPAGLPPTLRRQKKFRDKYKRFSTKVIFV